ncbi:MAG: hypothetical protein ACLFN8_05550 [Candidatus Woesearchaeota archaeon]
MSPRRLKGGEPARRGSQRGEAEREVYFSAWCQIIFPNVMNCS